MKELIVDAENFEYPPTEVVQQGTSCIIEYICNGK